MHPRKEELSHKNLPKTEPYHSNHISLALSFFSPVLIIPNPFDTILHQIILCLKKGPIFMMAVFGELVSQSSCISHHLLHHLIWWSPHISHCGDWICPYLAHSIPVHASNRLHHLKWLFALIWMVGFSEFPPFGISDKPLNDISDEWIKN